MLMENVFFFKQTTKLNNILRFTQLDCLDKRLLEIPPNFITVGAVVTIACFNQKPHQK